MCGIAGILRFDGSPVAEEAAAMARLLAHRGPDEENIWTSMHPAHSVGLAHRRLSIRDLSGAGRQPMASRDGGLMLTYNGEIYNDAALARTLVSQYGLEPRGGSDTEIIVETLACRGPAEIRKLNGIFAFAAYDRRRGELLLARDPVGIKPLYLWRRPDGGALAFASEVKAFFALPDFGRHIDPEMLLPLLTQGYVGPTRSLLRHVVSVAPGQVLRVSAEGIVSELARHRLPAPDGPPLALDTTTAAALLRPAFEAAVARQRVSDVPLAVWQSAGIDFSLVNAACRRPRPHALTITSDSSSFDELAEARLIGSHFNSEILPVQLEDNADPGERFRRLVWHLDGELADSSALAVERLAAATRPHATVVLSGDGADEVFGGYATYAATGLAARFGRRVPKALAHRVARWCLTAAAGDLSRYPALEWAGRFLQGLPHGVYGHTEWRRYGMPWSMTELVSGDAAIAGAGLQDYRAGITAARAEMLAAGAPAWGQAADLAHYLPGDMLMKVDRMSMAHGLEVRVPFLDLDFLGEAMRLPSALRLPLRGRSKPVLRDMLGSYGLPARITERRKTGFNVPLADRLRGEFRPILTELLLDEDHVTPYLSQDHVRGLCAEHLDRRANHAFLLWTLMTFAAWRQHLGE